MRSSSVVALVALVARAVAADPAPAQTPASTGWIAGGMVGIKHVSDKTDSSPMSGTGPIIEAQGGWWLTNWLAATLAVSFSTIGTDLDYQLADGSRDHLRQYDVSVGARFMLRVNEAFSFGPTIGVIYDDQHFTGLSTTATSRFYEIGIAVTPAYFGHSSIEFQIQAGYAPFFAGQYPIDYVLLGAGAKL